MRRSHKQNKTKYHQVPRTAQQITCMHNSGRTRKSAHCIGPTATLARWCVTLTLTWRSHVGVGGGVCMSAPNAHQLPHLRRHSGVDQSPLCCRCVCVRTVHTGGDRRDSDRYAAVITSRTKHLVAESVLCEVRDCVTAPGCV